MRYLSLYKTLTDHDTDASNRSIPNISLIIDEKKLILTNQNNNGTTFNNVNIIETFDKIPTTPDFTPEPPYNIFPTDTSTSIPVVKIYTDGSDAHNQINKDFYDNAQIWRNNYILNTNLDDTGQGIQAGPNEHLFIDDEIIYDFIYYKLDIFNDCIVLRYYGHTLEEVLIIHPNGSVSIISDIPTNTTTATTTATTTFAPNAKLILTPVHDIPYTIHLEYNNMVNSFTVIGDETNVVQIKMYNTPYEYYNIIGIDTFNSLWNVNGVKINEKVENIPFLGSVQVDDIVYINPVFERVSI